MLSLVTDRSGTTTGRRGTVTKMNKILHLILAIVGWLLATHRLVTALDAL